MVEEKNTGTTCENETPAGISFDIEASGACDSLCIMCPREKMSRPAGIMTTDTFNRIMEQIGDLGPEWPADAIWFTGFGEPLLNPNIFDFISKARKDDRIHVGLTTNGLRLADNDTAKRLAAAAPNSVSISVHGIGPQYNQLMPNASFDRLLQGVRLLISASGGNSHVSIVAVETDLNRDHIHSNEFKKFWADEGIENIDIFPCHTRGGNFDDRAITSLPDSVPDNCLLFQQVQFIAWNGDLLACCSDISGETRIGNVNETPLRELIGRKLEIENPRLRFDYCRRCPDSYEKR